MPGNNSTLPSGFDNACDKHLEIGQVCGCQPQGARDEGCPNESALAPVRYEAKGPGHRLLNIWRTPHATSPKPIVASNVRNQDSLTSLRKPMQIPNSTSVATSLMIFGANL